MFQLNDLHHFLLIKKFYVPFFVVLSYCRKRYAKAEREFIEAKQLLFNKRERKVSKKTQNIRTNLIVINRFHFS